MVLNLESTTEPFPVKPILRGEAYKALISNAAQEAGVLEDAQVHRGD